MASSEQDTERYTDRERERSWSPVDPWKLTTVLLIYVSVTTTLGNRHLCYLHDDYFCKTEVQKGKDHQANKD